MPTGLNVCKPERWREGGPCRIEIKGVFHELMIRGGPTLSENGTRPRGSIVRSYFQNAYGRDTGLVSTIITAQSPSCGAPGTCGGQRGACAVGTTRPIMPQPGSSSPASLSDQPKEGDVSRRRFSHKSTNRDKLLRKTPLKQNSFSCLNPSTPARDRTGHGGQMAPWPVLVSSGRNSDLGIGHAVAELHIRQASGI